VATAGDTTICIATTSGLAPDFAPSGETPLFSSADVSMTATAAVFRLTFITFRSSLNQDGYAIPSDPTGGANVEIDIADATGQLRHRGQAFRLLGIPSRFRHPNRQLTPERRRSRFRLLLCQCSGQNHGGILYTLVIFFMKQLVDMGHLLV
jgi:hypothetical protein